MKVKIGYSMGYAGTATEWEEEVPEEVVSGGSEAVDSYIETLQDELFHEACEKISVWAKIVE